MKKPQLSKGDRLIATASELIYRQGYRATSLADIAEKAGVPLGNIYYYFKTKDAIGESIIDARCSMFNQLREHLEAETNPRVRLKAFVQLTIENRENLARSGCPNGTLSSELHKEDGPLAQKASAFFSDPLDWMADQFRALKKGKTSRALATHLMAALQGIAVLAHALNDPEIVLIEARTLNDWIDAQ